MTYIPMNIMEIRRIYSKEEQDYVGFESQLRMYDRWVKRANMRIPELASRVFALRNEHYVGCGFHHGLERKLGNLISKLNDYDDCPRSSKDVFMHRVIIQTAMRHLYKEVVDAENSIV